MRRHLPPSPLIEPLESRIAPAAIVFTATNYSDVSKTNPKTGQPYLLFINAAASGLSAQNQALADSVGDNPNVYFIKVTAGEDVRIPTKSSFQDLVNVTNGTVVAFFTDLNSDGVINSNELTGLSLGTKVSVAIGTDVHGDVITNYNDLTGLIGGANGVANLLANTVTSLSVTGGVTGGVVSGGNVSRLVATGDVHEILTGTAANAYSFSFDGTDHNTLTVATPLPKIAGPSLSNVVIGSAATFVSPGNGGIQLGAGGPGAAGGSLFEPHPP